MNHLIVILLWLVSRGCVAPPAFAQPQHQLVFPLPPVPSREDQARELRKDFIRTWNEFAEAANDLMRDEDRGLWPLKKRDRVARLWAKVEKHPGWRR